MPSALPTANSCVAPCCTPTGVGITAFGNAAKTFTAQCVSPSIGQSTATVPACTIFRTTQVDADAAALAAAQAQAESALVCDTCPDCPPVGFGPLNNAIYESGRGVLFGVRGGRVYSINATTGAKISSAVFATPDFDDAYIVYSTEADALYASLWANYPDSNAGTNAKLIYKINPDTLATIKTYNVASELAIPGTSFEAGVRQMISAGGFIYGLYYTRTSTQSCFPWKLDTLAESFTDGNDTSTQDVFRSDLTYDTANSKIWMPDSFGALKSFLGTDLSSSSSVNITERAYGICYRSAVLYCCLRTRFVRHRKTDGTGSTAIIDLGRPNATPFFIRFNSVNDRIYVPLWADNTVAIINPADDSFVIKTGFDAPFDVVFTPTKVFAIQHGDVGIKEIV